MILHHERIPLHQLYVFKIYVFYSFDLSRFTHDHHHQLFRETCSLLLVSLWSIYDRWADRHQLHMLAWWDESAHLCLCSLFSSCIQYNKTAWLSCKSVFVLFLCTQSRSPNNLHQVLHSKLNSVTRVTRIWSVTTPCIMYIC